MTITVSSNIFLDNTNLPTSTLLDEYSKTVLHVTEMKCLPWMKLIAGWKTISVYMISQDETLLISSRVWNVVGMKNSYWV